MTVSGKCYRCGYCCQGCMVPKYADSDLSPAYLDSLALRFGEEYAAHYAKENSLLAEDACRWLSKNPDGVTTSCMAYERRSSVCRMHNSRADCDVGRLVMRQYGLL